jgi:putative transposase
MRYEWPNGIPDSRRKRKRTARLNGFTYIGNYSYLITIRAYRMENIFVEADLVGGLAIKLIETAEDLGFTLLCYCFMPNHLHFVCTGGDDSNLIRFVQKYKGSTSYHYKKQYGKRLWHRGYYDRILRKSDDRYFAVEYVMDNPLRAGHVKNAGGYPFSKAFME